MEIYGLCEKNKRLSIYKINSIEWDGDAYLPANNLAYKYVATYTADVTEPDAATIYDIIHFLRREMLNFTAFPVFFVSNLLLVQRKKYYFNRATVSRNCSIVL